MDPAVPLPRADASHTPSWEARHCGIADAAECADIDAEAAVVTPSAATIAAAAPATVQRALRAGTFIGFLLVRQAPRKVPTSVKTTHHAFRLGFSPGNPTR